jgi:uncharacterized protein (DUF362 family)
VIGDDPVAADVIAASIMGIDPGEVAYLSEAARFLGQGDPERIQVRGEDPSQLETSLEPAPGFEGAATG